ncbi:MAG: flagellar biosynthetic protein FliO [Ignavibacteria bacterium]|jgi:flagellar protein FliO/FliZ|nr:flagellar biosynthetic protein FliO [Ignavibacteria bacterium]
MDFFDVIKMLLPLLIIIAMLYGLLVVVRKYSFSLSKGKTSGMNIKIVGTQMLLPKKFISVVRVKDKMLVLGVSESSITLLKEIDADDNEIVDNEMDMQNSSFADMIKKNLGMK